MREYYLELVKIHQAELLNVAEQRRLLNAVRNNRLSKKDLRGRVLSRLGGVSALLYSGASTRQKRTASGSPIRPMAEDMQCLSHGEPQYAPGCESVSFSCGVETARCPCSQ